MPIELDKKAYQKLIEGDIAALNKCMPEHSLERKHIVEVLNYSVKLLYPDTIREVVEKGQREHLKNVLDHLRPAAEETIKDGPWNWRKDTD